MEMAETQARIRKRYVNRRSIKSVPTEQVSLDPSTVYCPLEFCQEAVPGATGTEDDEKSGWRRLRMCNSCGYSFCSFCKRTWYVAFGCWPYV